MYTWNNCPDAHCPVLGGRGTSGLADFTANKQITLPDLRGRICSMVGLDDMGNSVAGRITAGNVTSGGGDGVTTPNATGGEANHTLTVAELAAHSHTNTLSDPGHVHTFNDTPTTGPVGGGSGAIAFVGSQTTPNTGSATTGVTITNASAGSGTGHNTMGPFMLGTCYLKL